jgi:hypothetical protein
VRNSFDQRRISLQDVLQDVFRIAGRADAQHFERGACRLYLPTQAVEHVDGVLDRVPLRQLIDLAEDVAVGGQQDRLGGRRTAVEADEAANNLAALEGRGRESLRLVRLAEGDQLLLGFTEPLATRCRLLRFTTLGDVVLEAGAPDVAANRALLIARELHRTERGEVLRVGGHLDQRFRRFALRDLDPAFLP